MRTVFSLLAIIFLLSSEAYAAPTVRLGESIDTTDMGELEDLARDEYNINLKELVIDITEGNMSINDIGENMLSLLFGEIKSNSGFMRKILLLCILNGIIAVIMEGFAKGEATKTVYFATYTAAAGMLIAGFRECTQILTNGVGELVEIMQAGTPLIICIVSAASGGGAALSFAGILSLAVGVLNAFIGDFVVPQIIFAVMLGMLNCLWEKDMVSKMAQLFAFLAVWETKLCAFLFVGFLTLGRIGAAPASALTGKGIRLAVGAVPVVGGLFENSLEAVVGFVGALKGGVAVAAVIIIAMAALTGLVKLCGVMLMYKFTAALSEPIGNKKITDMIDLAAEGVKLIIGAYFTVAIMLIAAIGIMLASFS